MPFCRLQTALDARVLCSQQQLSPAAFAIGPSAHQVGTSSVLTGRAHISQTHSTSQAALHAHSGHS